MSLLAWRPEVVATFLVILFSTTALEQYSLGEFFAFLIQDASFFHALASTPCSPITAYRLHAVAPALV